MLNSRWVRYSHRRGYLLYSFAIDPVTAGAAAFGYMSSDGPGPVRYSKAHQHNVSTHDFRKSSASHVESMTWAVFL